MEENSNWICFDSDIIPAEKPIAPATSRGLMYGDGVFDTLRIYSGRMLLFSDHWNRTQSGLKALGINMPDGFDSDKFQYDIKKLLKKNKLLNKDAIVRLQVWRSGQRGYKPESATGAHYSITASECPNRFDHPHLVTIDRPRIPSESLPSEYKFTNGINYILAAQEAVQKGGDGALMQTTTGWISETTIANIFWCKGSMIYTPSADCDLLPGITRGILMDIIQDYNEVNLETGKFELDHILQADAVWMSNSVRELLPVKSINRESYTSNDEVFRELKERFQNYRDANLNPL